MTTDKIIFAVETEEQTLHVFASEEEATAHCDAMDVESAIWLFWNHAGRPMTADFMQPNARGFIKSESCQYRLVFAPLDHHADLDEALEHVLEVVGPPPLDTAPGVAAYLKTHSERPMTFSAVQLPVDVRAALDRGDVIDAVKLLRDATGLGLAEAKDIIDRHRLPDSEEEAAPTVAMPRTLSPAAAEALQSGNKIEAIRITRDESGLGLREAKMFVESFESKDAGETGKGAPGEVGKSNLRIWLSAAFAIVFALSYYFMRAKG